MFRLDRVLDWKKLLERRARADRAEVERRAADLTAAADGIARTRAAVPDAAPDDGGVEALVAWSRWTEGLRRKESILHARLRALEPELEARRRAHVEIRREVRGLDRLKERAMTARKKLREKKAQEAIDDVTARRNLPGPGWSFPVTPAARGPATGEGTPDPAPGGSEGPNRGWGT